MNKEKYNQIIEAVGQEYTKWFYDNAVPSVSGKPLLNGEGILTRGEFINKCKTDTEFSEKWGLKIEERELSRDERIDLYAKEYTPGIRNKYEKPFDDFIDAKLETRNIPTKLITITYNDNKLESYE
jgi:hypothetical protein